MVDFKFFQEPIQKTRANYQIVNYFNGLNMDDYLIATLRYKYNRNEQVLDFNTPISMFGYPNSDALLRIVTWGIDLDGVTVITYQLILPDCDLVYDFSYRTSSLEIQNLYTSHI